MTANLPRMQIVVSKIPKAGVAHALRADADQLAAIAGAAGVLNVEACAADVQVKRWKSTGALVEANVKAQVVQECVNTLEPINTALDFSFARYFLSPEEHVLMDVTMEDGEMVIDPLAEDLPDEIVNDRIDLWEIMLEELNLNIDPFVKNSDFDVDGENSPQENEDDQTQRPFSGLKALLENDK